MGLSSLPLSSRTDFLISSSFGLGAGVTKLCMPSINCGKTHTSMKPFKKFDCVKLHMQRNWARFSFIDQGSSYHSPWRGGCRQRRRLRWPSPSGCARCRRRISSCSTAPPFRPAGPCSGRAPPAPRRPCGSASSARRTSASDPVCTNGLVLALQQWMVSKSKRQVSH